MRGFFGFLSEYWILLLPFVLLPAVYLLPPDTAFQAVKHNGSLKVCVPSYRPPLITDDSEAPGIEIELLQRMTQRLGVELQLTIIEEMDQSWNPKTWGITRDQCEVIAGGLVDGLLTRSFVDVLPPYFLTGWMILTNKPLEKLKGTSIGVFSTVSGLDRVSLGEYLLERNVDTTTAESEEELVEGLHSGLFVAVISDAVVAQKIADEQGWKAQWVSDKLEKQAITFGLWKGDLTLKRSLRGALHELNRSGELRKILERYHFTPISQVCEVCQ